MAFFGDMLGGITDFFTGGGQRRAGADLERQYREAQQMAQKYYDPFYQAGVGGIGQYQNYMQGMTPLFQEFFGGGGGGGGQGQIGGMNRGSIGPSFGGQSPPGLIGGMTKGSIGPSYQGGEEGQKGGGWFDRFKKSGQYQDVIDQALKAQQRGQAASGMIGSGAGNAANMRTAANIENKYAQDYFNNMLRVGQMYGGGANNLMNMGMNAAGGIVGPSFQALEGIGAAQGMQDMAGQNAMSNMMGMAAGLLPFIL